MLYKDFIDEVASRSGMSKKGTRITLSKTFELAREILQKEGKLNFPTIGHFKLLKMPITDLKGKRRVISKVTYTSSYTLKKLLKGKK